MQSQKYKKGKKMNIENLSKKELNELKSKIELRLRGGSFLETLSKIKELEQKKIKLNEEILLEEETSKEFQKLKEIGFSVVFYNVENIGLINYSKSKIKGSYYGVDLNLLKYELKNERKNPVSTDELEEIKKILNIKG